MKFLNHNLFTGDITVNGTTTLSTATGITRTTSDSSTHLATTAFVKAQDYATNTALGNYVPLSRTLTINNVTYDLSANRSWTIGTSDYTSVVKHAVKAGVAITKGQAIYVTSADGTNMIVGLASNATEATSSKTMGLAETTVAINGFTNVVTEGLLAGLNTVGANAGDPVWLGTGGNLIYGLLNKPYAPAHLVFIGIVTRVNANNGEIFVKVQNGFELKEIHDVDLITVVPVNGHLLGYNGTLWVNKTIAGWLGYTPANASGTTNYVSKFTGTTALGNSQIFDDGTNVGIGTTDPTSQMSGTYGLGIYHASYPGVGFKNSTTAWLWYGQGSTFKMWNVTAGDILTANTSGNIGIGTTSPTARLHVEGNATPGNYAAYIHNSSGGGNVLKLYNADWDISDYLLYATNGGTAASGFAFVVDGNGKVGIGTTTPNSQLQVGSSNFAITGRTSAVYGAASETIFTVGVSGVDYPQLLNFGVNQSGLYSTISARQFTVATENKLVLQPNGGNVGIGTTAPTNALDVLGKVKIDIDGTYGGGYSTIGFGGTTNGFNRVFGANGTGDGLFLASATGTGIYFRTNGGATDHMVVMPSGNVGIGTASPANKLQVANGDMSITSGYSFILADTDTNWRLGRNIISPVESVYLNSSTFEFVAANASDQGWQFINDDGYPVLEIGAATGSRNVWVNAGNLLVPTGSVGIGTTSPISGQGTPLTLASSTGYVGLTLSGSGAYSHLWQLYASGDGGSNKFFGIYDSTNAAYRLVATSGGNVGIGTTSPGTKLDVNGVITATGGNSTNWNTAYGWGNHASAGYLTSVSDIWVNTAGDTMTGTLLFAQPVGLGFANGQYIKDNSSGGLIIYSGAAVGITGTSIAVTGAATFSSSLTVGSRLALQPSNFGYSSGYKTLLIGSAGTDYTTNAVSLAFNVDISGNPSGAFTGNGYEYIWRNTGAFITPNAANTTYNTLFTWNSSGQLTFNQAATLSSSLTVERIQINSSTYEPLAINSSYGQVGLKFGLNGTYFAAIGSANNVTGAYAGSETDLGIGTSGSATANITFATGTGLGRRMTITAAGKVGIGTTAPSEEFHVLGRAIFDGGSGNSSTDAVVYITKSTNDDWGLYVNNAGLDYGMYTRVSPSANYALAIYNGTTWTTRITGNAIIYLGEKNAIEGNYDSWLRLNNSSQYASGVYTPGVMRADGGFNVSGSTVWHAGNDGSGSGLDADLLDGNQSSTSSTANTIALRDSVGDISAREFVLTASTIHTTTPSSIVGIFPTTNQVVKFADTAVRTFLDVPTRTGGDASGTWAINVTGNAATATSATSATSATQVVTLQDNPPTGVNGKLWWETDTGILKVYYGAASAWIDALPMPDVTLFYPKAGGAITGDVSIQQSLTVSGNILTSGTVTATGGNSTQWNTAYGWGNHAGLYLPLTGGTLSGAVVVNLGNVSSDTVAFKVGGPANYDSLTIGMEDTPDYDAYIASFGNDIRFYAGKNVGTENHSFHWYTSKAGTAQHSQVAMLLDYNQNLSVTGTISATNFSGSSSGTNTGDQTNISGNAATATNAVAASNLSLTSLGTASVNVNNGSSAVYRNENGSGGNLSYAPVLHLGGGDTMWQIQGDYYDSSTLRWRAGYNGTWYAWRQIYHSGNFTDNSSNWNTAYGWGNHASAGYAAASSLANYLPLAGGSMTGDINMISNTGIQYTSTHWIRPRDSSGNLHIKADSGGIYLDADVIHLRGLGGVNDTTVSGGNITTAGGYYTNAGLSTNGSNGALTVQSPGGASRGNASSSETGAFKIKLPAGLPVYGMFKLVIHIYEYGGRGNGYEIHCGGHLYPNYMYNRFQVQYGASNSPLTVRYGNDGSTGCIWIGNLDTTWSYPQIWVSEFMIGYSNTSWATWRSGWSITLDSASFGNSGAMDGPYTCEFGYAATANYAATSGNAGTATALQTGRTLTIGATGKTFDGTGNVSWTLGEIGAQAAGSYVIANGTSAGNIDADWGQSFKTFDPVPSGTPPLASPNIRTINVGDDYNRRTQLAFDYASDVAYFRRRNDSGWQTWREFIHSGNIGTQSVSYATTAGALTSMNISQFTNNSGYITGYTETNTFLGDGGSADTHPGTDRLIFTGQLSLGAPVLGMPSTDNSNAIININRHPGEYNSQLGFSSNGSMYYRSFSAVAINNTLAWRQVWDSGNLTNLNQLTNGPGYITGNQTITLSGDVSGSGTTSIVVTVNNIDGWGFVNTGSNSPTDADSINSNGISYYTAGVTNFSGNATDGALYSQRYSDSWQHQIAGDYRSGQIALRGKNNGTWQAWRTVLDSSNFTSWAVSTTYNSSLNSDSRNSRGVTRLYRRDDDSDFSVQHHWTGSYWWLRGYNGDTFHAEVRVAYADSAGSAGSASSATSATQVVTIQDDPPTGVNGKLWWESDTGKLKVYYGTSSAWVDATPVPDMSLYYAKAGGPISGDVTIQQTLTVVGNTLIQGTLTETSDISLKENILPLESSLDKVMKLNGVSFNKKATPNVKEIGFIAQEVQAVIPDLVTETNEGIKTVSYSRVTAVLVETIKEQQSQIEELKNMVNMLAEKLNSL